MGEPRRAGHHLLDPVLLGMAVLAAATVPWFLAGPGGAASSWVIQTGLDLTLVALAARLAAEPSAARPVRRFYRSVVAGGALCAAGDAYQTVWVLARPDETGIRLAQSVLVTAGMSVVVLTMLAHPMGPGGRRRLRLWLDAATALTAIAAFLWYFSVGPQLAHGGLADRYVAATGAAVMLVIAFGVVKLILSGTAPFTVSAGTAGSIGVAGTAVGTSAATMLAAHPGVAYVFQLLPCILTAAALRLQQREMRERAGGARGIERRFSRMPYVAVVAIQLLLLVALHDVGLDARAWGVVAGVAVVTVLVLTRQLIAFHDNDRLLTDLDRTMHDLRSQEEWFRSLVQHASDMTLVSDDTGVRYAGPAVKRVLGIPPADVIGTQMSERLHPDDRAAADALLAKVLARPGVQASAQLRLRHADGTYRWLDVIATDLRDNASVGGVVFNARDVTVARHLQEELRYRATHDTLTGLANRTLLQERLEALPADAPISLAVLDLDGFKQVNDAHGHHAGDALLAEVARRLTAALDREDLAVRIGGDEFALLLPGADRARAERIAERCAAVLREPVRAAGTDLQVGASVGVATGTVADTARLLVQADAEMYVRKHGAAGRETPPGAVPPGPGRPARGSSEALQGATPSRS